MKKFKSIVTICLVCALCASTALVQPAYAEKANVQKAVESKIAVNKALVTVPTEQKLEGKDNADINLKYDGILVTKKPITIVDVNQTADVVYDNLAGLGDIKYTKAAVIGGKQSNLLAVFVDPDKALTLEKQKGQSVLKILSEKFNLPEFDSTTWRQYSFVTYRYSDDYELVNEGWFHNDQSLWKEFSELESFFDIYGDTFTNEQAQSYIEKGNAEIKSGTANQYSLDAIISNFCSDEPIQKNYRKAIVMQASMKNQISGLTNITAANNYAMQNAVYPNNAYYNFDSEGGDCTNFVSQICLAGGVPLDGTWGYTMQGGKRFGNKTWRGAQQFKAHFGDRWHSGMNVASHFTEWTHQLYTRGGAVIGKSRTDNDHYHHLAYVVARSNTMYTNPNDGVRYYDIKVAQHSGFYCKWISSDSQNGWLQHGNDIYGILS